MIPFTSSRNRARQLSLIICCLIIMISCSVPQFNQAVDNTPAADAGLESGETSTENAVQSVLEPNPLQVDVTLDDGSAVKAVIPIDGGSITAAAPDGTRFTLTIPVNALLSEQSIQMTPVASIAGLPLDGGYYSAVDLKPEGLLLFSPATLTIERPEEAADEPFLGFSFLHEGDELFLFPSEIAGTTASIQLMHFSGYGGGSGSSQSASDMNNYSPSSGEDQAMQAAASAAARSGGQVPTEEFENILRTWHSSSVEPGLRSAVNDDSNIERPITEFLRWAAQVQLCGLNGKFEVELANGTMMVSAAIENAINKASQRCSSQMNPIEARKLIRLAAMAEILGELGGPVDNSGFSPIAEHAQKALEKAAACGRFELQFDSIIETLSGCSANFISHVRATVLLIVDEGVKVVGSNTYKGEGTLEYVEFSPPSGCPPEEGMIMCPAQNTGTVGSTFTVSGATMYNLNYSEEADSQPPNITLFYSPGEPEETMVVQCPDAQPVEMFGFLEEQGWGSVRMWRDGYKATHQDDLFGEEYLAQDWDYNGGSLYARKVYQGRRGDTELGFSVIEDTTMDLFFKPQ